MALALAAMAVFDAPGLGWLVIGLLLVTLIAREVTMWGFRGLMVVTVAVVFFALVVQRSS